jgi:hypothetical protein
MGIETESSPLRTFLTLFIYHRLLLTLRKRLIFETDSKYHSDTSQRSDVFQRVCCDIDGSRPSTKYQDISNLKKMYDNFMQS